MAPNLNYLVVGVDQSGLKDLHQFLTKNNVNISYQYLFHLNEYDEKFKLNKKRHKNTLTYELDQYRVRYYPSDYIGEISWYASPLLGTKYIPKKTKILFLIRHPIDNIRYLMDKDFFSVENLEKNSHRHIRKYLKPYDFVESLDYDCYVQYYCMWNQMISQRLNEVDNEYLILKYEELEYNIPTLEEFFNVELPYGKIYNSDECTLSFQDTHHNLKHSKFSNLYHKIKEYEEKFNY